MVARFWVGGTGTWDNSDTTHWAQSSGTAGGFSVPAAADNVTFDGSSGGGTVTVAATINASNTLSSITEGTHTGTLDFSVNNPSITITSFFDVSGTATRTVKLGSGTYTFTANNSTPWDAGTSTNLTLNAGTSTILYANPVDNSPQTFAGGGKTYGTLSIAAHNSGAQVTVTGSNTFANFLIAGPASIVPSAGGTSTVTNAIAWNGSSSAPLSLATSGTNHTWAVASGSVIAWAAIRNQTFTGTTVIATNSLDLKVNTGVTITAPSTGGVVGVIGS